MMLFLITGKYCNAKEEGLSNLCDLLGFIILLYSCLTLPEVPKLSSYAKAEDKLFKYLFGSYQKWVRPVEQLNQTIRVKFGLAISQLVDVVRMGEGT